MEFADGDIKLMLRFQGGDETCFERLVELHKARVFNMAYGFLGCCQDAEDSAQEVFLKIYRAKNTYRPQAKFTTWLYTITRNTCLKALDKKHPGTVSLDGVMELEESAVPMQAADPAPSPADSAAGILYLPEFRAIFTHYSLMSFLFFLSYPWRYDIWAAFVSRIPSLRTGSS